MWQIQVSGCDYAKGSMVLVWFGFVYMYIYTSIDLIVYDDILMMFIVISKVKNNSLSQYEEGVLKQEDFLPPYFQSDSETLFERINVKLNYLKNSHNFIWSLSWPSSSSLKEKALLRIFPPIWPVSHVKHLPLHTQSHLTVLPLQSLLL